MYASSFYPTINTPTRITSTSITLVDNIFYNCFTKDVMSNKIKTSISDNLTQFLRVSNKNSNKVTKKQIEIITFNKKTTTKNKEKITAELDKVNWDEFLELSKNDINISFKLFIQKISQFYEKHCAPKKVLKRETNNHFKPGLTQGILKSIKIKNRIYKQFCTYSNQIKN